MKRLAILLSVMLLAGCSPPKDNGCYSKHNYSNDVVGITGLTLKATSETFITFDEMEAIYKDVQSCLNLSGPGPTIEYHSFTENTWGGAWAFIIFVNDTIYMNTDQDLTPRNCHSDRETLRHEFVHHLLYMYHADATHGSPDFARCKAKGVNTCNGVPCE